MKSFLCVVLALGIALTISSPTSLHAKDKDKDPGKSDSKQSDSKGNNSDKDSKGNDSKGNDSRDNDSRGNDRGGNHWGGYGSRDQLPFYVYPKQHNHKDFSKLKGKLLLKLAKAIKHFENHKIIVCHKGHAISISREALHAHLAHGDTIGRCDVTPTKNH